MIANVDWAPSAGYLSALSHQPREGRLLLSQFTDEEKAAQRRQSPDHQGGVFLNQENVQPGNIGQHLETFWLHTLKRGALLASESRGQGC